MGSASTEHYPKVHTFLSACPLQDSQILHPLNSDWVILPSVCTEGAQKCCKLCYRPEVKELACTMTSSKDINIHLKTTSEHDS